MTRIFVSAALVVFLHWLVIPVALAGIEELDEDFDGDGIINRFDNCYLFANPLQGDADGDGFGNRCDTDLNNDLNLDFKDLALFRKAFLGNEVLADFNEDGAVNFLDLRIFKSLFNNGRPGPAVIVRWAGGSGDWGDLTNWIPNQLPNFMFVHAEINGTDDHVVVTQGASAKSLVIAGSVDVRSSLSVNELLVVNGSLGATSNSGQIYAASGIDLSGTLELQGSLLETSDVRKIPGSSPLIQIKAAQTTEIFNDPVSNEPFRTEVDIDILPGGNLIGVLNMLLVDATLTLRSEPGQTARIFTGENVVIGGSGGIVFTGANDPSATGEIFNPGGSLEIAEDITISLTPGAHGYLRVNLTNFGTVHVEQSATLNFQPFGVTFNSGAITCSTGGQLREFSTGTTNPGDSVLINNATGTLTIEDCVTHWPTRIVNQGEYVVDTSELVFPLIGAGGQPLSISNSAVTITGTQQPLPADFYLLGPATGNTFLHQGVLNLGDSTLEIDADNWRFTQANETTFGSRIEFGTLNSNSALTINSGANVELLFAHIDAPVNIETGATLVAQQSAVFAQGANFVEQPDCDVATVTPATLELQASLDPLNVNQTFVASGNDLSGAQACLKAEIVSQANADLTFNANINVFFADMAIRSDDDQLLLTGVTTAAHPSTLLWLEQVTTAGQVACTEGATLRGSGTFAQPFVIGGPLATEDCNFTLDEYWRNDGNVFMTRGTLDVSSADTALFFFGDGNFVSSLTDITFDIDVDLDNLASLNIFELIPPGGSFTVTGGVNGINQDLNLSDFPVNTRFEQGLFLQDSRVFGNQLLILSGLSTFTRVQLETNTLLQSDATLDIDGDLTLVDADLVIQSTHNDTTTARFVAPGNLVGSGTVKLEAINTEARSLVIGPGLGNSLEIDAGIDLDCAGGGTCVVGFGLADVTVAGNISIADPTSLLQFGTGVELFGTASVYDGAEITINFGNFVFQGPESALEMELVNDASTHAALSGSAPSFIDITDAALRFSASPDYVLEPDAEVFVLEHSSIPFGESQRIGEFADISEANIDGQAFEPDYSSNNVTTFRLPPAVAAGVDKN